MTDFQLFNKSLKPAPKGPLFDSITESDHIDLSHQQSVFSFEFASLHFSTPSAIKYAYKLEGFDNDWLYTDATKRHATYTNLDGGTYTFRIKATNSDGTWRNNENRC